MTVALLMAPRVGAAYPCASCGGSGFVRWTINPRECPTCRGSGRGWDHKLGAMDMRAYELGLEPRPAGNC